MFLKISKAQKVGKIHRIDMELTFMLTMLDTLQNDIKVKGQISVLILIIDTDQKPLNIDCSF